MYPENDGQYADKVVKYVNQVGSVTFDDGWAFYIDPKQCAVKVGDKVRLYSEGLGSYVRGVFVNGVKVFYRTAAEDEVYRTEQRFGATAQEWLDRWDAGRSVWSVTMGGLGPGYEQAIQIAAAEVLRRLIEIKFDYTLSPEDLQDVFSTDVEQWFFEDPKMKAMGLSGAQWNAATNLACSIHRRGPVAALSDEVIRHRLIQVSKNFPQG